MSGLSARGIRRDGNHREAVQRVLFQSVHGIACDICKLGDDLPPAVHHLLDIILRSGSHIVPFQIDGIGVQRSGIFCEGQLIRQEAQLDCIARLQQYAVNQRPAADIEGRAAAQLCLVGILYRVRCPASLRCGRPGRLVGAGLPAEGADAARIRKVRRNPHAVSGGQGLGGG